MAAKPIVAGTDGSEESLRAVDWAAREAALRGAPLRIVSAEEAPPGMITRAGPGEQQRVTDVLLSERDQALAAAAERAAKTAHGVLIDTDQLTGSVDEAVTDTGSGALMLVLGSGRARSPPCCSARSAGTSPATRPAPSWSSGRALEPTAGRVASPTWTAAYSLPSLREASLRQASLLPCTPGTRRDRISGCSFFRFNLKETADGERRPGSKVRDLGHLMK